MRISPDNGDEFPRFIGEILIGKIVKSPSLLGQITVFSSVKSALFKVKSPQDGAPQL